MLSHGNITSNVIASCAALAIQPGWTALSFLPLAHSFERTVAYIYFHLGVSIAYAESVQTVAQNLGEVRPNVFVSVPRVYEKVMARAYENARAAGGLKQARIPAPGAITTDFVTPCGAPAGRRSRRV